MTKKGLSGDMVLQIGLLAIAAFTTLMAVNLFYDSVEVSVFGDPYLAAKTMSSYTDFVDASPVPLTIYHEIPQDFAGNPGYGSVLYNPENCEFLVNKYPQDYMSEVILNHAWDTITLEEALSIYALNKWNKKFGKNAAGVAAKSAAGSAIGEAMAKKEQQLENQAWTNSIERQGYTMKNIADAAMDPAAVDAIVFDKESRGLAPTKGEFTDETFYWNEKSARYHDKNTGKFISNAEGDKLTKEFLKGENSRFKPENIKYDYIDPEDPLKKIKNPNAQRNLRFAISTAGVDPDGKVRVWSKLGKKELNVHNLKKISDGKIAKAGFFSKTKDRVVKGSIALKNLPGAIFQKGVKNFNFYRNALAKAAAPKAALKELGERLSKSAIRGAASKAVIDTTNAAGASTGFGAILTYIVTYGMAVVSYGMEYWWTYLPIKHFIERSQDATAEINKEWSSVSCISKPEKVITTKPNCKSESDIIYPEFEDVFILGDIPIVEELAEAALAMPSSKPILESKDYNNIESVGEVCVDYHNYLLSDEVDIIGDKYVNPREVVLTVPFASCGAVSAVYPGFGPGCTTSYAILYLSNWVDPEMGAGSTAALTGGMALLAGPSALALTTAFLANPIDSTNFFPYVSKSAGMVDTQNYYYIENPYLISISKDYKDGEYVTEINKEL